MIIVWWPLVNLQREKGGNNYNSVFKLILENDKKTLFTGGSRASTNGSLSNLKQNGLAIIETSKLFVRCTKNIVIFYVK